VNRFARIMQGLGWTGVALLTVVWAQGFVVRDDAPALAQHSTLALAAACFCILPRLWTIAYLTLAARARRRHGGVPGERAARLRRLAVVAAVVAIAGLAGSFALAGAILARRASPLPHALVGCVGIALQIAALLLERRALLADAEEMAAMSAVPAPDTAARRGGRGGSAVGEAS